MAAEWCETDPPAHVDLGPHPRQTIKVFFLVPTKDEARAAHKDAFLLPAYDRDTGEGIITIDGIRSLFKVRVETPNKAILAQSGTFQPGERATMRFPLTPRK